MLGLICESRRTTELPHPAALRLVLQFIHLNGSTQSTGFRYDIVTCIRKVCGSLCLQIKPSQLLAAFCVAPPKQ